MCINQSFFTKDVLTIYTRKLAKDDYICDVKGVVLGLGEDVAR